MLIKLMILMLVGQIDTIKVVFTNDIIGQFGEKGASFINPVFPPPLGGAASFYTYLKNTRKTYPNLLLFDTGNMTGGYVSGQDIRLDKTIKFYKLMGYNAMVPGWREFFKGEDGIEYLHKNGITLLAANLTYKRDTLKNFDGVLPYKIFNVDGVKIGVFGLTTEKMPLFANDWWIKQTFFLREIETARRMVNLLKNKGADIIILLSSTGSAREKAIADSVYGIDFIFGGFMGYGLREPYENYYTHTVILRNYRSFSQAMEVNIFYDKIAHCITGYKAKQITLMEEDLEPDERILKEFE